MNTYLKTGVVLLGLLAGISAVSAAPAVGDDELEPFGSDDFWSYMIE